MTSLRIPRRLSAPLIVAFLTAFALVLVPSAPASAATPGISGTVTGPGGAPLQGIEVDFFLEVADGYFGYVDSAATDANGNYAKALSAGTWRVAFSDSLDGDYVTEFFDDSPTLVDAEDVVVTSSAVTPGINASLASAGHITGHVEASDGTAIAGAWVDTYALDGGEWVYADAWGFTDQNGDYDVSAAPGTYRLEFSAQGYVHEFYDDQATVESGTSVVVSSGATASGKDAVLDDGATLRGTLTLPPGADPLDADGAVTVVDDATGDQVGWAYLDPDDETSPGSNSYPWSVGELPAGSYRVEFALEQGPATSEGEFFDDQPESAGPDAADDVQLTTGEERTDIDATLRVGGTISGKLVDGNGAPLADCGVLAVNSVDDFVTRVGTTDAEGDFVVTGLTEGDYGVVVGYYEPGSACSAPEYYTNANGDLSPTPAGLIAVAAAPGADTPIGATLVYGGSVAPAPSITNTTPPTIPGSAPTVGTPVTADPGTWNPADVTLTYQWRANGGLIPNATGQSYTPPAEATGLSLSVTVTATRTGYTSKSVTSNSTAPVVGPSPGQTAVQNFAMPSVLGVPRVGDQLSANPGTWTTGATTSVQWLRNGEAVPGATGATYTLGAADAGAYVQVRVTATKPGLTSASRLSTPAGPVQPGILSLTDISSILGTLKVGKVLRVAAPTSSPSATTVRYRWFRNGVRIKGAGANDPRYRLVSADRGKRISVRIKLLRPGYATSVTVVKRAGRVR